MTINSELVGVFHREKNRFENNDGDVIIGYLTDKTVIKGPCEVGELKPGVRYKFEGHKVTHETYGDQFVFKHFVVERPYEREETVAYLEQLDGVGPVTAGALWETYKDRAIEVLKNSPEHCVGVTRQFTADKVERASKYLKSWEKSEHGKVTLIGLLKGRGFPKKTVTRALEQFGIDAAEIIRRNPYRLIQFPGCAFRNTDALYADLASSLSIVPVMNHKGIMVSPKQARLSRLKRQALCMLYGITSDTQGHTWHDVEKSVDSLRKYMGGANINVKKSMTLAMRAKMIVGRRDCPECFGKKAIDGVTCTACNGVGGKAFITDYKKSFAEYAVAVGIVNSLFDNHPVDWPSAEDMDGVDGHQKPEISKALATRIGILSGSPGTGKTFCVSRITKLLIKLHGSGNIALCAPTGKAAQRINEMLTEYRITGISATTIHRLLGVCEASDGGGFKFAHDSGNPLPYKYIICDEGSMVDVSLFGSLISALRPNGHLLLVGDPNQLSPVGHGCPLRDLIRSRKIGVGELTEIRRNSGLIVKACKKIREEHTFEVAAKLNISAGDNLSIVECRTTDQQIEAITKMIGSIAAGKKYDPIWDCQVLVAVNEASQVSRKIINQKLQALLNPHGLSVKGNPFRIGDKIINNRNNWYNVYDGSENISQEEVNDDGQIFVANGEMGKVYSVHSGFTVVSVANRGFKVRIPNMIRDENESGSGSDWEIAYAISTHKSQGSEWLLGIVVIDDSVGAKMVCSREWLFTALSRFKVCCQLVGKISVAKSFCLRSSLNTRKTFLVDRISELIQKRNRIDEHEKTKTIDS